VRDYEDHDEPPYEQPRDAAIDRAIERLRAFFKESPQKLYYSTQIETTLEREFFHWITGKALLEMADAREIQRVSVNVQNKTVNFYAGLKHRYWRRELSSITALLQRIFDSEFTHAIGRHGELMFDAALGRTGFRAEAKNVNTWNGRKWQATNHNLDRIFTRDQFAYGVEIKNTQNYISREELQTKIQLCKFLEITPLFIMRFAPKSYIHEVNLSGGFVLLFEQQIYPMGHAALLSEVRDKLALKVHSPNDIKDGDMQRLLQWHERRRKP
jgi:hypothetical protein